MPARGMPNGPVPLGHAMNGRNHSRWREIGAFSNVLTLVRIVLTPLFVWWFVSPNWALRLLSVFVFAFAAITDWWDGHHARKHDAVSDLGRFLDPLADKLLTIVAMLTFAYLQLVALWMVLVIFARDFFLTWMRVQAGKHGRGFRTLWFAKLKTTVQLVAISAIIGAWTLYTMAGEFQVCAGCVSKETLVATFNALIALTMVLALISGGQYVWKLSAQETIGDAR